MNLLKQHEDVMNLSFLAKQARSIGDEDKCLDLYSKAAGLESEIAEYYFDKPELEPTRSVIIRSAAFLNLKAGLIEKAERYVFWGLVNSIDPLIKDQLYEALEICIAFKDLNQKEVSGNIDYLYQLRRKSVFYSIQPKNHERSTAVTLEMISDFSTNYTKSIKAYSSHKYMACFSDENKSHADIKKEAIDFGEIIKPVVTTASFGSFKFSLASDFLYHFGENKKFTQLKSNILVQYHDNIFSKELTDENIDQFKDDFSDDEIDEIFRPLFNIKSNRSEYSVSYYDRDSLKRLELSKVKNSQKSRLFPAKRIDKEDIGQLENIIAHTRTNQKGIFSRNVILKQELKSYSFDYRTAFIEPKGLQPIILKQEIVITVDFSSLIGFTFSFDDLPFEASGVQFNEGLNGFYLGFIDFIKALNNKEVKNDSEQQYWSVIKKLIESPQSLI